MASPHVAGFRRAFLRLRKLRLCQTEQFDHILMEWEYALERVRYFRDVEGFIIWRAAVYSEEESVTGIELNNWIAENEYE